MSLNSTQKKDIIALKALLRLFEEKQLQYFLLAGSALGAVRHKGFIPWDDDIDVGILYSDLELFEEIIEQYLPDGYKYINYTNNTKYPRLHGKVIFDGKNCIDIFPIVKVSDSKIGRKIQWLVRKITWKLYSRKVNYVHPKENTVLVWISTVLAFFFTKKMILRIADWNCKRYENKRTQFYCNIYSTYSLDKELIYSDCVEQPQTVQFEGLYVYTVGFLDKYLRNLYGDYMKLPPENKRVQTHDELFS